MNKNLHCKTALTEFARDFEEDENDTIFSKIVNRFGVVYNNLNSVPSRPAIVEGSARQTASPVRTPTLPEVKEVNEEGESSKTVPDISKSSSAASLKSSTDSNFSKPEEPPVAGPSTLAQVIIYFKT